MGKPDSQADLTLITGGLGDIIRSVHNDACRIRCIQEREGIQTAFASGERRTNRHLRMALFHLRGLQDEAWRTLTEIKVAREQGKRLDAAVESVFDGVDGE